MRLVKRKFARHVLHIAWPAIVGAVGFLLATGSGARAADAEKTPSPSDKNANERIAALVRQLGDDDCTRRELASAELSKLGIATKKALSAATDDADLEIRIRARHLLAAVIADDFQRRLQEFAADATGVKETDLPGWSRFKEQFGNGEGSRRFFVEMQKADAELLAAVEAGPKSIVPILERRKQAAQLAAASGVYQPNQRNGHISATLAMVFAATVPEVNLSDSDGAWLATLPQTNANMSGAIRANGYDGVPKKIIARWVGRPLEKTMQETTQRNLQLSWSYNLAEGVVPARNILTQPVQGVIKQQAILVLAKHGDKKEDLPRLESLLEDTSTCTHLAVPNRSGPTAIQVRDIALCAAIRLSGQEPKDFGYEFLVPHELVVYNPNTIGFADNDKREAALKKWREWSAAQKK